MNELEHSTIETEKDEALLVEEKKDLRKFPLDKILWMVLCYFIMLAISFMKGSEKFESLFGVEL